MKKSLLLLLTATYCIYFSAQNVGINQPNPTNSLHISPINIGEHPLKVDGLQAFTIGDTSILVINPSSGVVKYMNATELSNSLVNNTIINNIADSLLTNSTFINNFGDSLFLSQNFTDSLTAHLFNNGDTLLYNSGFINSLRDSIDTDVDSVTLTGSLLTIFENGSSSSVNLSSLSDNDGDPTNEIELPSSAVLGQVLTWNGSDWIAQNSASGADNWGTQAVVSGTGFSGNGTTNTPLNYTETDGSIINELQTLSSSGSNISLSNSGGTVSINDADSNPSNEYNTSISLSGNTLSILDGGGTISIDLTPLINTAVSNAVPPGTVTAYAGITAPSGYLFCDGSAVSRATYSDLFTVIGTMYGNGNGSTTFNLPNYTGQFLRGLDNGQGTDLDAALRTNRGDGITGDAVGTKQTNQTLAHNHSVNPPATNSNNNGNHSHTVDPPSTSTNSTGSHFHGVNPPNRTTSTAGNHNHGSRTGGISTFNSSTWVVYDDNLSNSTTPPSNSSPTTCGSSFNGQGTIGNFMGRLNSSCLSHTHTISSDGNHSHSIDIPQFNSLSSGTHNHLTNIPAFNSNTAGNHSHNVNIPAFNSANSGGNETRPTNISVLWCIKF